MRRPHAFLLCGLLLTACTASKKPAPGLTEAQVDTTRGMCGFKPGMLAKDTLPAGTLTGKDLPIKHIVLLMQENRSFDHYMSQLTIPGVDVAPLDATNPDSSGNLVQRFHFTTKCMGGGNHGWSPQHFYIQSGQPEGFVIGNGDSSTPMGYYDATDLPFYYALASTFATSDRHFCSVLGPTWPNREFYFAGTSWGHTGNDFPDATDADGNPVKSLFSELEDAGRSWRVYAQDVPTPGIIPNVLNDLTHVFSQPNFASDVAAGTLADVTIVEASDLKGAASPDEGPPGDIDLGQQFISQTMGAVMNSPFWKDTAIFLTWDENGGMYDHVIPPAACPPDDLPPIFQDAGPPPDGGWPGANATFNQYGLRVPFFVVSPYAKRGYLSHVIADHTAILRFVEATFDLPSLSMRDANAAPPYDMFDFDHPDFTVPNLPVITVDEAALTACEGN